MWLFAQQTAPQTIEILDRLLQPGTLVLLIPVLAVASWGIHAAIRALRGEPEDGEELRRELEHLRARLDKLESGHHLLHQQLAEARQAAGPRV